MQIRKSLSVLCSLWLVPIVVAASTQLSSAAAFGQACSAALGLETAHHGKEIGSNLEFLNWNIQKAGNTGWAEDLADVSQGIDLVFIQEASLQANIPTAIPANLHPAFAAGYTTASRETGVLTLSTGVPSAHCALTSWEPWLGTPKATSVTEHPLQDRQERLLAINVHAINFDLALESFDTQFEALREVLTNHIGPIILAGDLNTWSAARQALVDDLAMEYGLNPVAFEPDLRTTVFGRPLDHIYVRGLQPDYAWSIPVSSSDHNPMRVSFSLL